MTATIITIGLDGPNRVGKGTQLARLHKWLTRRDIPALIIRGDGSRTGLGIHDGDPVSQWWQEVNTWLRKPQTHDSAWNMTSYLLARELIVWRDRIMPCRVAASGKSRGVLLIDRSLLSRTMVLRALNVSNIADHLYPEESRQRGRRITAQMVCPDVLIHLHASQEALLSRLNPNDPKYEFRRGLIERTADWFAEAADHLPPDVRARIVRVNAEQNPTAVFRDILAHLPPDVRDGS